MTSDTDGPSFFTPPTAAIPSRSTAAPARPVMPETPEEAARPPRRGRTGDILQPRRRPAKKAKAKKTAPPRRPVAKKTKKRAAPKPGSRAATREVTGPAPKNPNRPLEMKTQLHAVLAIVAALTKRESLVFANGMATLEGMTRSERKRIIAALAQVYG